MTIKLRFLIVDGTMLILRLMYKTVKVRALGDLDRISAWGRVFGMVNSASGFNRQPSVINGFSDLILELYGPVVGAHSRSAVGLAELAFDIPVEIEGEVEFSA